ncbi:MAG: hypothetical protein L0Y56_08760, partial [Nitrospira sp.]|nr:hypothetical protein [Nitrospira sp.]
HQPARGYTWWYLGFGYNPSLKSLGTWNNCWKRTMNWKKTKILKNLTFLQPSLQPFSLQRLQSLTEEWRLEP